MTCSYATTQGLKKELNNMINTYAPKNAVLKKPAWPEEWPSVLRPDPGRQCSRRVKG